MTVKSSAAASAASVPSPASAPAKSIAPHAKSPVASRDKAPASSPKTRLAVNIWATSVLILLFGSIGVRNLIDWGGFFALAAILLGIGIFLFIKHRPRVSILNTIPKPLILFLTFAFISAFWSRYPFETVLGSIAQLATSAAAVFIALLLTWNEILRALSFTFKLILAVSMLFELWVAIFVRHQVIQNFVPVDDPDKPSVLLLWSRNYLFQGGPIQGIIANSALLGMIALLAFIVFAVQLKGKTVNPVAGWFWLALATATIILTKVATVLVAIPVVLVALALALWARRLQEKRWPVYLTGAGIIAAAAAIAWLKPPFIFNILGRESNLTNRTYIWEQVAHTGEQSPIVGIGWISHWVPWVEPLKSIAVVLNLPVLHAHNAWIDVWMQLGYIGLAIFGVLVLVTLYRLWFRAVDQPRGGRGEYLPFATDSIMPWLFMIALFIQSLSESRLLVESGWLMLILFAVKSKADFEGAINDADAPIKHWKDAPVTNQRAS